jgi:hypothetical protein
MTIQNKQNFLLISNLWKDLKKVHPEKVICKKLLQISSIEEENPKFAPLFACKLANIWHFSQLLRNQRKILHCFDTTFKFCE